MKKLIFGLLALAFIFTSCGGGNNDLEIPLDDNGNEKFEAFLNKFLEDSTFQYNRIDFPLQVVPSGEFGKEPVFWESTDWKRHLPLDSNLVKNGQVKQRIEDLGGYVREHIYFTSFYMRREYNLSDIGRWELTYFMGMQDGQAVFANKNNAPQDSSSGIIDTTVFVDIRDSSLIEN